MLNRIANAKEPDGIARGDSLDTEALDGLRCKGTHQKRLFIQRHYACSEVTYLQVPVAFPQDIGIDVKLKITVF